MTRINNQFKKVFGLFVLACVTTILSAATNYGQEREPVLLNLGSLTRDGSYMSCCAAHYRSGSFPVPAGRRLVIEYVSLELHSPAVRATGRIQVITAAPGRVVANGFPFLFTGQGTDTSGDAILTASHPMKLYVANPIDDSNVTVRILVIPQSNGLSWGHDVTISGYLEPLTAPADPAPTP